MKNILHLIIGLIGTALVIVALFQPWFELELNIGGGSFNLGNLGGGASTPGTELWQGIAAAILAGVAMVLLVLRMKIAAIPGILVAGCAVLVMVQLKELQAPQMGIWLTLAGGVLLTIGGILTPRK